jgi:hypothetical protein
MHYAPDTTSLTHRRLPALLAVCGLALAGALPAAAAPVTLQIQGLFTATNSNATLNSAAAKALATSVNGSTSWNALSNIALRFEIDLDDTPVKRQAASNVWNWFLEDIDELRIQLGNAHFSTRGDGSNSLGSVKIGATSTEAAPAPALSTGMLLDMWQPWTRNTAVSPAPYSFAGATPQVSGGGLYEHHFRTAYDFSAANRVLDFWGTLASNDSLFGGLPTGRWQMSSFSVTPRETDPPITPPTSGVPEPGTWALSLFALLALAGCRRRGGALSRS